MNTLEINKVLSENPITIPYFKGVFAADKLPNLNCTRSDYNLVIANTDTSDYPGTHWVLMWLPRRASFKNFNAYFFDLYGLQPHVYCDTFANYLLTYGAEYFYNTRCLQSAYSNVCGEWCLYTAFNLCYNSGSCPREAANTVNDNLALFRGRQKIDNDHYVLKAVKKLFEHDVDKQENLFAPERLEHRGVKQNCICMKSNLKTIYC